MRRSALSDLLVCLVVAATCVLGACARREDNATPACVVPGDCASGFTCYRGYCIPGGVGIDAAVAGDAGDVGPVPDAGCEGAGGRCDYRLPGRCSVGVLTCSSRGTLLCTRANNPIPEECNGEDDDCDSKTDEGTDVACTTLGCPEVGGVIVCDGVCAPGVQRCMGGTLDTDCEGEVLPRMLDMDPCTPMGSVAVDDDCDGEIDEDCTCTPDATIACYTASQESAGIGACSLGTATCTGGAFGSCVGAVAPTAETCANAGADDDCNGVVDDVPGTGLPCDTMRMGACADGVTACDASMAITCVGPEARTPELCDEADDDCDGMRDEDFDLTSDEANCGECGHACSTGQTCCDSVCVSTQADDTNCGMCGMACGSGTECCQGTCRSPMAPECTGCPTDCSTSGQTCCEDEQLCVDGMTDSAHCGATEGTCGTACGMGQRCCGGTCVGDSDTTCGGCSACSGTQQCCGAPGSGACVADLDTNNCLACGERCASGEACCATDGCTNLQNDEDNCGRCGNECAAGDTCSNGVCCSGALVGCGGSCVNLQTDEDHCGTCGRTCGGLTGICCRGGCAGLCL